jgi:putative transposase
MNIENNKSKIYKSEYNMVYSCQYHVIFCPKYRRKILSGSIEARLRELILEKQIEYGYNILEMEIMPDHIHLLIDVNPKTGIYKTICKIKGHTSNILRSEFKQLRSRLPTLWTRSKFISTVGSVSLDVVKRYIEEQKSK